MQPGRSSTCAQSRSRGSSTAQVMLEGAALVARGGEANSSCTSLSECSAARGLEGATEGATDGHMKLSLR